MKKTQWRIYLLAFVLIYGGLIMTVSGPLRPFIMVLGGMYLAIVGTLFLAGRKREKEEKTKTERELRRQRIQELEQELGIEPLNLDELDPVFEGIEKEGKRK